MALICLKSLLATSQEKLQLVIHDDGSLTGEDQALIRDELPKALVVSRDQADGELARPLEAFPVLRQARPKLPHLLKILDVPMLCRGENISFVDSDVFFLRAHQGLFQISKRRNVRCRFLFDSRTCHGFRLRDFWPLGPAWPTACLNSGLFCVRREAIDFEWIEAVCRRVGLPQMLQHRSWFEQGLWAAIAGQIGCEMIDHSQIATAETASEIPRDPIALHFITPVRELLKDYAPQAQPSRLAEPIRAVPAASYTIVHAAWAGTLFRLRRLLQ